VADFRGSCAKGNEFDFEFDRLAAPGVIGIHDDDLAANLDHSYGTDTASPVLHADHAAGGQDLIEGESVPRKVMDPVRIMLAIGILGRDFQRDRSAGDQADEFFVQTRQAAVGDADRDLERGIATSPGGTDCSVREPFHVMDLDTVTELTGAHHIVS
jgi:hypothetical protein